MSVKLHSYRELADTLRIMVWYKISIPNFRYHSGMMFTNTFKHPNCSCLVYTYPNNIYQFDVPASAMPTSVKTNSEVESRWCLLKTEQTRPSLCVCSASKCCLMGSYDQYGIAQQFAISRVSYVSEWMLFGSNKFISMTVKQGLSCLVSGIVYLLWVNVDFLLCSSRACTV